MRLLPRRSNQPSADRGVGDLLPRLVGEISFRSIDVEMDQKEKEKLSRKDQSSTMLAGVSKAGAKHEQV